MTGWRYIKGKAAYFPKANVDTDQLIPARFMSTPRSEGYGKYLLHDQRRDSSGQLDPTLPINRIKNARVLIAERNFGSGSSREAAVYALIDAGFGAVIAPSFGDIFSSNSVNNGLLPVRLEEQAHAELIAWHEEYPDVNIEIDLDICSLRIGKFERSFVLEETWRRKLINGWDDIDITKQHFKDIEAYRNNSLTNFSWVWPSEVT